MRPLAALLLLPLTAAAQDRCAADPVLSLPSSHVVAPTVVRWWGDDLVLFGDRAVEMYRESSGQLRIRDSVAVGLRIPRGRGVPVLIPRPVPGEAFEFSRAFASDGALTMLWGVPVDSAPEHGLERHDLRVGRWDGVRWKEVQTLGRFTMRSGFAPQTSSELVTLGGVRYFAMVVEDTVRPFSRVAIVSDSGGRWRAHAFDIGLRGLSAVALGVTQGRLVLNVLGIPMSMPAGRTRHLAVPYVTRLDGERWTPAIALGGSPDSHHFFPKLFDTPGGLIAAWTSILDDGQTLHWRKVSLGAPPGPVHVMHGTGFITQGQPPFQDVVSVLTLEGRAKILRLRPDGFDEFEEFRLAGSFAPAVGGSADRPIAAYPVLDDPADAGGGHVELRDLRCALRRAPTGGRR